jgi:hypothetical protein
VARVAEEVNRGPDPARREKLDPAYWQSYDLMSVNVSGRLGLLVKSVTAQPDYYAYLDIEGGKVTGSGTASPDERADATYVIGGRAWDWKEVWSGRRTIGQNIMYRRVNLFQGNLHEFMRNVSFFTELLTSARRVPTEFGPDAEVRGSIGVWEGVTT